MLEEGKTLEEIIDKAKDVTAGILVKRHRHNINGPFLLNHQREKEEERCKKKKNKERKERQRIRSKILEVQAAMKKNDDINKWTKKELESLYQAKKQTGDPKMASKKNLLLVQVAAINHRPLPPLPSAEECCDNNDNNDDVVLLCGGCGLCAECAEQDCDDFGNMGIEVLDYEKDDDEDEVFVV